MFYNFDRPGKGIAPNTPKKEGIALFFDILYREFWAMVTLNFAFLAYCMPVFTIGASYAAMNSVLIKMIRDKPVDAFSDFRDAFKENFKQGTGIFILKVFVIAILVINFEFYSSFNPFLLIVLGVSTVLLSFINLYLVPVAVSVELPFKNVLKNSFYLTFLSIKYTLLSGLILGSASILGLLYFPYSMPLYFIFSCVFFPFVNCFLTYYGIKKYCYPPTEEELALLREKEEKEKEEKEKKEQEEAAAAKELVDLDKEIEALDKELKEVNQESEE